MRHTISWTDLVGHPVGLWGLGVEGLATLRHLRALGVEPVLVDESPDAAPDETVLALEGAGLDALRSCAFVVKAPGISRYRPEVAALEGDGIPVLGGLGLWLQEVDRSKVVAVTGTKGKSTTTSILAHLATGLGVKAFAGGNLGVPPFAPEAPTDPELWVIEVSSYQATDVACSPPLTVVTSLHPDHLPWHGDTERYYRDKLSLCSQPGNDLTVAPATSPTLREREDQLGARVRWVPQPEPADTSWMEPLGLLGSHNAMNAELARVCLEVLGIAGGDDPDALRAAAEGFPVLASRLERVASVAGVDFVDDSLSTNVLPTLAAVEAFAGRRLALIAGGLDRGIDFTPLAAGLAERAGSTLVLTAYGSGPRIAEAVTAAHADDVTVIACADLTEAVERGFQWARPEGTVLLSPASASFGDFSDYRHRARVFREAVAALAPPA